MEIDLLNLLAWLLAVSSGMMAGVYLAFSGFIMTSFAALGTGPGIAAMNAINTHIINSVFMPLFFGSSLVAAGLAAVGAWQWHEPGAALALAAGLIYVLGMFGITALFNVPLNNRLADVTEANVTEDATDPTAETVWAMYLQRWTRWNSVRTLASLLTLVLCINLL